MSAFIESIRAIRTKTTLLILGEASPQNSKSAKPMLLIYPRLKARQLLGEEHWPRGAFFA